MFFENSLEYILNSVHARQEFTDGYVNSKRQVSFFKEHSNRKKDGSLRRVYEPKRQEQINIYKSLYEELKKCQHLLHDAAHGFRVGYSNYTNARMHLAANHLLNIDIENFYDQIKTSDVQAVFERFGASVDVASYLSRLCTIDGRLPQGLHTSPDIANHHLYGLDEVLFNYSNKRGIVYTRYVDDMSFSSSGQINSSEICSAVEAEGLKLAKTKKKYQKRGANQYVTGLTIFDSDSPRISKKYKKRLRLELFIIEKVGVNEFIIRLNKLPAIPSDPVEFKKWRELRDSWTDKKLAQLKGRIDYVNGVEPELAKKMYPLFEKIIDAREKSITAENQQLCAQ